MTGQRDGLRDTARWLVAMGYPFDWSGGQDAPPPPTALREAVIDVIHEDRGGKLHGNTLTREETEAWLDMEASGFARIEER